MFLLMASARGAFSASTRLWASVVTSMPEPLPNFVIMLALAVAPESVVLLVLLVVVVELVVDGVEDDTDVTMALTY